MVVLRDDGDGLSRGEVGGCLRFFDGEKGGRSEGGGGREDRRTGRKEGNGK